MVGKQLYRCNSDSRTSLGLCNINPNPKLIWDNHIIPNSCFSLFVTLILARDNHILPHFLLSFGIHTFVVYSHTFTYHNYTVLWLLCLTLRHSYFTPPHFVIELVRDSFLHIRDLLLRFCLHLHTTWLRTFRYSNFRFQVILITYLSFSIHLMWIWWSSYTVWFAHFASN